MMECREATYGKRNYEPTGDVSKLFDDTFYLTGVDDKFRRHYAIKGESTNLVSVGSLSPNKTFQRLSVLESHLTANDDSAQKPEEQRVMRSMIKNFHRRPLPERLN